jgi:hypothetical protein
MLSMLPFLLSAVVVPVAIVAAKEVRAAAKARAELRGADEADERVARRLASELGASVERGARGAGWVVQLDARTALTIRRGEMSAVRQLPAPLSRELTLSLRPYVGRSREDYGLMRVLVHGSDGWWGSPGPEGRPSRLDGCEANLATQELVRGMQEAGVDLLSMGREAVIACAKDATADRARAVAALLEQVVTAVQQ